MTAAPDKVDAEQMPRIAQGRDAYIKYVGSVHWHLLSDMIVRHEADSTLLRLPASLFPDHSSRTVARDQVSKKWMLRVMPVYGRSDDRLYADAKAQAKAEATEDVHEMRAYSRKSRLCEISLHHQARQLARFFVADEHSAWECSVPEIRDWHHTVQDADEAGNDKFPLTAGPRAFDAFMAMIPQMCRGGGTGVSDGGNGRGGSDAKNHSVVDNETDKRTPTHLFFMIVEYLPQTLAEYLARPDSVISRYDLECLRHLRERLIEIGVMRASGELHTNSIMGRRYEVGWPRPLGCPPNGHSWIMARDFERAYWW